MQTHPFPFLIFTLLSAVSLLANDFSLFSQPDIRTRYSDLLQKKQAVRDSLLPALDGDRVFENLVRDNPQLWGFQRLDRLGEMVTRLKAEIIYIDGVQEEQFCEIDKGEGSSDFWSLRIGVDFTSGGSNTVPVHVQQCLEYVRNELGYKVRKGDRVVEVPPRKLREEMRASSIPQVIDPDLQARILKAHRAVKVNGQCPQDIEAYAMLLDVWDQVKDLPMDIGKIDDYLNPKQNGGRRVHSCAFSREWNERYSEESSMECRVAEGFCKYSQSEDGTTRWQWNAASDRFEFVPLQVGFLRFGGRSIHEGGRMLDLKLLPLSSSIFLEAYVDLKGNPVTLGLVTIPEE